MIIYCCVKVIMLLAIQYTTKPEAKVPSMNINTQGIHAKIIAWVGSVGAGFNFCCSHIDIPSKIGKTPNEKMNNKLSEEGVCHAKSPKRFNIEDGSGALRSYIHQIHGACRSSRVTNITLYSAKKIGICSKIGRQPAAGLTFSFL